MLLSADQSDGAEPEQDEEIYAPAHVDATSHRMSLLLIDPTRQLSLWRLFSEPTATVHFISMPISQLLPLTRPRFSSYTGETTICRSGTVIVPKFSHPFPSAHLPFPS